MNKHLTAITRSGVTLALVTVLQVLGKLVATALGLSSIFVGSIVNLVLLCAVPFCGVFGAAAIGMLTPVVAFFIGQVAFPVLIPFIATGNALLVVTFYFIAKIKLKPLFANTVAVIVAALVKFAFFALAMIPLLPALGFMPKQVGMLSISFGVIQLIAALIGGVGAITVMKILRKTDITKI